MNSRIVLKNLVVGITLAVAALATWAVTQSEAPAIEAAAAVVQPA